MSLSLAYTPGLYPSDFNQKQKGKRKKKGGLKKSSCGTKKNRRMPPLKLYVESESRKLKFQILNGLLSLPLEVMVDSNGVSDAVKRSPQGKLPVLETPEGYLNGSSSILRYMSGLREDLGLLGVGLSGESAVDGVLEWALLNLEPATAVLAADGVEVLLSLGLGKSRPSSKDELESARLSSHERLPPILSYLNTLLVPRTWLAGERVTVADIAVGSALASVWGSLAGSQDWGTNWPHLARWYATFSHTFAAQLPKAGSGGVSGGTSQPPASSNPQALANGPSLRTALDAVTSTSAQVPSSTKTVIGELFSRHRVRVADLLGAGEACIGRTVTVCGWLRTVREGGAGSLFFLALNDGSCFSSLQVVVEKGKAEGFDSVGASGGTGASIRVVGEVVKSPAKGQSIEVNAIKVEILGVVQDPSVYPLAKKKHTLEYLRDIQHLRPRTNTLGAVTRIRNACAFATHTFFNERGFLYIHTPIVTAADCEGAGEMFGVTTLMPSQPKGDLPRLKDGSIDWKKDFFGRPTMLTVSGQLQVEAFACSMSDVYTFGPTFRAENSHTSRHLAEFWMIEPEIAFATLKEDMALAEDYLKFCTQWVLDHCSEDLKFFEETFEKGLIERLKNVVAAPFKVLTYTEAIELLLSPEHVSSLLNPAC